MSFNPFLPNAPNLYRLKIPENLGFSVFYKGYTMGVLVINRLSKKTKKIIQIQVMLFDQVVMSKMWTLIYLVPTLPVISIPFIILL